MRGREAVMSETTDEVQPSTQGDVDDAQMGSLSIHPTSRLDRRTDRPPGIALLPDEGTTVRFPECYFLRVQTHTVQAGSHF